MYMNSQKVFFIPRWRGQGVDVFNAAAICIVGRVPRTRRGLIGEQSLLPSRAGIFLSVVPSHPAGTRKYMTIMDPRQDNSGMTVL
jgi:hypothetical protein